MVAGIPPRSLDSEAARHFKATAEDRMRAALEARGARPALIGWMALDIRLLRHRPDGAALRADVERCLAASPGPLRRAWLDLGESASGV